MAGVSLAEAGKRMADLLDGVGRGADVLVTREGAPTLRPAFTDEQPAELARFRGSVPPLRTPSADLIREMRGGGY